MYGVLLEYVGPKQANIDVHLKTIEMAAVSKVDGIMTQGLDDQFTPLINRVIEQGIPVVTVDTDTENSKRFCLYRNRQLLFRIFGWQSVDC